MEPGRVQVLQQQEQQQQALARSMQLELELASLQAGSLLSRAQVALASPVRR